jgi:acetyl esterase/lipase
MDQKYHADYEILSQANIQEVKPRFNSSPMRPNSTLTLTTIMLICASQSLLSAPRPWQPLWTENAPVKPFMNDWTETITEEGFLTYIDTPEYQLYLPENQTENAAAVVIFPGGGYSILAADHEGKQYAEWLNERGIVAAVVKYRVGKDLKGESLFPIPLLDARRAIRILRSRAQELGIDPQKIGVMGSSAGGHLASTCATLWHHQFQEEANDNLKALSCRPDFAILVYPVISTTASWRHKWSGLQLVGNDASDELTELVSSELQVTEDTPSCFLVHCADDHGVPARNSMEFAARCAENKVPVNAHLFNTGGHGFGLKCLGDGVIWPDLLEKWLRDNGLIEVHRS